MFELRPYRNNNHMTTYDPFRDMEALERAFFGNRDFLGDVGTFKTDIQDKGDHYLLEADLPGMKKEDIAIDIDGDNLTIKAERRNEHEEKDKSYVRCAAQLRQLREELRYLRRQGRGHQGQLQRRRAEPDAAEEGCRGFRQPETGDRVRSAA